MLCGTYISCYEVPQSAAMSPKGERICIPHKHILGSFWQNDQKMKLSHIVILLVFFLGAGCTFRPKSDLPASIPTETSIFLPPATPTLVTLLNQMSCEPSSNPYTDNPLINPAEAAYLPNIEITRICTIKGKISKGEAYRHQVAEDLVFCLVPSGVMSDTPNNEPEGWRVVITDTLPGSCDVNSENYINFGPIVTPPFHGNTSFWVFGWQFRNEDNTQNIEGRFNRYFNFVFDREDHDTYWYGTRCDSWNGDTDCAMATQTSKNTSISRSSGKFTVTELELGNLIPNSNAWIEYMEFRFEVYLADG